MFKSWRSKVCVSPMKAGIMAILIASICMSGFMMSYNAYANAIKAQFNLSQTQATVLSSVIVVTSLFMLPGGVIQDVWGLLPTVIICLVVTTMGWAGFWLAVLSRHTLSSSVSYYCLLIGTALAGHGRSYTEILIYPFALSLVSPNTKNLFIFFIEVMFDMGSFFTSLIYERLFINGHELDPQNQSLGSFVLLGLIVTVIMNVISAIVIINAQEYRNVTPTDQTEKHHEEHKENGITHDSYQQSSEKSPCESEINENKKQHKFYHDIITIPYILLFFCISFPISITMFTTMNITLETGSLYLARYDYYLVITQRVFVIIGKLITTCAIVLAKRFQYTKEIVLVVINLLLLASQVVGFLWAEDPVSFWVMYTIICLNHGGLFIVMPVMMVELFSIERIATNLGLMAGIGPIISTVVQVSFGLMYDSQIPVGSGIYCYGKRCVTGIYIMGVSFCAIGSVTAVGLLCFLVKKQRQQSIERK